MPLAPRRCRPVPAPGAGGAATIDGAEAGARPYCVGGPAGRLLDAEAEQLGSTSIQAFEIEGLIGARKSASLYQIASVWPHVYEQGTTLVTLISPAPVSGRNSI